MGINLSSLSISSLANDLIVKTSDGIPVLRLPNGLDAFARYFQEQIAEVDKTLIGTEDSDRLTGGDNKDLILGLGGDDILKGGGGPDEITTGSATGSDRAFGGDGNDKITGGNGDDFLSGDGGNDTILGGLGDDAIAGSVGNDFLDGGPGADTMNGGAGKDTFVLSDNRDMADGRGNVPLDRIVGFDHRADIVDLRNFAILGIRPDRDDIKVSDSGDADFPVLVSIDDPLSSKDIPVALLSLASGTTMAQVQAAGQFRVGALFGEIPPAKPGTPLNLSNGADTFFGDNIRNIVKALGGNDLVTGGLLRDLLNGGKGDDTLNGEAGDDRLEGGAGADTLDGGKGKDKIDGGAGDDILRGGDGSDKLSGGAGNDTFIASGGKNVMTGGGGKDTFVFSKAAMAGGTNVIKDFDPEKDKIVLDKRADMTDATYVIDDNKITLKMDGADGPFKLIIDAYDGFAETYLGIAADLPI